MWICWNTSALNTIYISSLDKENTWHSCIDCQEQDFEGWPESADELPVRYMTEEHRSIISEFCTEQCTPAMPGIPSIASYEDSDQDLSFSSDAKQNGFARMVFHRLHLMKTVTKIRHVRQTTNKMFL